MNRCFLSIAIVLRPGAEQATDFVRRAHAHASLGFSDFEIIVINDDLTLDVCAKLRELPQNLRGHVSVINLANRVDYHNALLAGLGHANGDYAIILDANCRNLDIITRLYDECQKGFDVVHVRVAKQAFAWWQRCALRAVYRTLSARSNLKLDLNVHDWRIVSRRALNTALQLRERTRSMHAVFAYIGYRTNTIEAALEADSVRDSFAAHLRVALRIMLLYTDVFSRIVLKVFIGSLLLSLWMLTDSLAVKLMGVDLFGTPHTAVPGWTFLAVSSTLMFMVVLFVLYIISLYVVTLNTEVRSRPSYVIESVQRP